MMELVVTVCILGAAAANSCNQGAPGYLLDGPDIADCWDGNFTHAAKCYKKARPALDSFEYSVEFNNFLDEWVRRGRARASR